MSYAPTQIVKAAEYLVEHGLKNLGIVGDVNHTYGYHLGKDRLRPGDYSIETARDQAGLTNAASALDIGGGPALVRPFSLWLVERLKARHPSTLDIREFIYYSPERGTAMRWDAVTGREYPNSGHLTHSHVGWFRDAQLRNHTDVFRPYFEEGTLPVLTIKLLPWEGRFIIPAGATPVGLKIDDAGQVTERKPWPAAPNPSSGPYDAIVTISTIRGNPFIRPTAGFFTGYYVSTAGLTLEPGTDPTPYTKAQLDTAVSAERGRWESWNTSAQGSRPQ